MGNKTVSDHNASPSSLRSIFKIPLRTSLLFMALVASWLALRISSSERARKTNELTELKQLLGESIFDNPSQYGLAKEQIHYNYDWRVYLPNDQKYELCWALDRNDSNEPGLPTGTIELEPGLHRVRLFPSWSQSRNYLVTLTVDGKDTELGRFEPSGSRHDFLADVGTPKNYTTNKTSFVDGEFMLIYQQPTDQPLEIIRAKSKDGFFGRQSSVFGRNEPVEKLHNGIRLWITSTKEARSITPK